MIFKAFCLGLQRKGTRGKANGTDAKRKPRIRVQGYEDLFFGNRMSLLPTIAMLPSSTAW